MNPTFAAQLLDRALAEIDNDDNATEAVRATLEYSIGGVVKLLRDYAHTLPDKVWGDHVNRYTLMAAASHLEDLYRTKTP